MAASLRSSSSALLPVFRRGTTPRTASKPVVDVLIRSYSTSGHRLAPRVGVKLPSSDNMTAYHAKVSTTQGTVTSLVGAIGNTPLIELPSLSKETGCRILGKAEFQNPGGSVKDRAALYVVKAAEEQGLLRPGGTVVEGTAGNTGIGLAHVCRSRGYKLVIYMPNTQSQGKIDLLRLLGAEVYPVPAVAWENPENYNWQAKRHAERVAAEDPERGAVWTNQFDNVANRLAHIETTGPEIWAQTGGKIDAFTCSTGTGGTLAGTTRYLKDVSGGKVKSFLADPPGSVLYSYISSGGKLKERQGGSITEGIGQGRVTDNLKNEVGELDGAVFISDEKTIEMVYRCLDEEGLYLGASSALNVVAAKEVALELGKGHTVVTILADGAYRYADRLFSETWLKSKGLRDAIPKHLEKYIVLPLPFPKPLPRSAFSNPDFDAADFLANLTSRFQTLDDLQAELRQLSTTIQTELVDLVNDHYEEFLGLGGSLSGGDEQVEELQVGLMGVERELALLKERVVGERDRLAEAIQVKRDLVREANVGRRLLAVDRLLGELELGVEEGYKPPPQLARLVEQWLGIKHLLGTFDSQHPFLAAEQPRLKRVKDND
ncbi:hypothetical protein DV738_g3231, partial [Chaetothyriales sp. CBS 135597]